MVNKRRIKYISFISSIAIVLLVSAVLPSTAQSPVSANKQVQDHQLSKAAQARESSAKENVNQELSHEQIVSLTGEFMDKLLQDTDDRYRVTRYDTKNALLNEFEKIAARDVASEYVDFYFHEQSDGLYIKPTETPPWFQENNDYDMIIKDNTTAVVIQENKSDLYGNYTVKFEFTRKNDQWKITNIDHN